MFNPLLHSKMTTGFSSSHVWMWELNHKEGWMPKNWCFWTVVLEKTLESSLDCKEIKKVNPKGNHFWIVMRGTYWDWSSNTLATWWKELTHWETPWCWGRLKAGGEGEERGQDGWMESHAWWIWVWASSGSWWWIGKPGVLQSIGSQRVRQHLATEQQQHSKKLKYSWKAKFMRRASIGVGDFKNFFLYFVLEYGRLRSGTLLTYLTCWLHKLQVLLFFWKSSAYHEKCLSVIKWKQFLMS